jgi:hypothetical protein
MALAYIRSKRDDVAVWRFRDIRRCPTWVREEPLSGPQSGRIHDLRSYEYMR